MSTSTPIRGAMPPPVQQEAPSRWSSLTRSKAVRRLRRDPPLVPYDGSTLLGVYLALLFLVPANLVIGPLGAAGSPASLFGVVLLGRWVVARVQQTVPRSQSSARTAMAVFALALLASYVAANLRPLSPEETNAADRGLITLMSWCGVFLMAHDGLPTRRAFIRVIRVAACGGAALAIVGLIQATTKFNPVDYIKIPGLTPRGPIAPLELRNGIPRVNAMATHPIEFATVLVLLLAVASPLALQATNDRRARWWKLPIVLMAVAFPLAVARSGFVAAIALAVVVAPSIPRHARRFILRVAPFGIALIHFGFPSLLGTVWDLLANVGQESARTNDYPVATEYVQAHPLFGQGFGTFLATLYRIFDNEYLSMAVGAGLVGLFAFLGLHVGAIRTALRAKRSAHNADDKMVSQFLIGGAAASLVSAVTFDSLSFPMFAGLFFVVIGLPGAWDRVMGEPARFTPGQASTSRAGVPNKPIRLIALGVAVFVAVVMSGYVILSPATYSVTGSVVVKLPAGTGGTSRAAVAQTSTEPLAVLASYTVQTDNVRASVESAGYTATYTVALGAGSLEVGTDSVGGGPIISVRAVSHDPGMAERTMQAVLARVGTILAQVQVDSGVGSRQLATLTNQQIPTAAVETVPSLKRASVGIIAMAGIAGLGAGGWLRRRRRTSDVHGVRHWLGASPQRV